MAPNAKYESEISFRVGSRGLLESLKTKLPNAFKDAPSGRNEVVILSTWLKSHVEQVRYDPKLALTEKLLRTDEIYSLTLNELIRQISCECLERGELFMTLWKNYLSLYNGIIADVKNHFIDRERGRYEESIKFNDNLKAQLALKNKEIAETFKTRCR